ncbi:amidohydrolase family protein [Halopseudomonas pelagia]|uniref:amidohydrolase family protein n=1 Tax=Halopseudomonas pelagia TaxID=553151 RepID=UPI00039FB62A|nr:amidohydrolase [Halopseudomonas pelagia]
MQTQATTASEQQVLTADILLPMTADNPVIQQGAVLVQGQKIIATGTREEIMAMAPEAVWHDYGRAVLMPGLINTHSHSGFLRGTAEDLPVWEWLRLYIDPMHRVLTAEDAEIASWLCYAESLLSGTTTSVDMWRHMAGSARAAETLGNRVVMVPYVGEAEGYDYFDTLDDNEALIQQWHGKADGRINVWVGLEHMYYATPQACRRAVALCTRYNTGLHTHSNEAEAEIGEAMKRFGCSPIRALERLGLLEPARVLLAHCVWLDEDEIALLAEKNIGVAHNPSSNMKLASGSAPIEQLIAAGVAVGIGTDGEKENNNLDMLEEIKIASLLAKLRCMDAAAYGAWNVLRSATIEGARAIGMDDQIGSLQPGKQADIIAVRADTPRMTPFLTEGPFMNVHHNLVHGALGGDVCMTMVAGRIVMQNQQLLNGDLPRYMNEAEHACRALLERRAAWLAEHEEGALSPL